MKRLPFTILCLLFFSAAAAQKNKAILNKGQVISSTMTSNQAIELGMGMQMSTDVTANYEFLVADIEHDSIYVIVTKLVSTRVSATGMGQDQMYNSETGEGADNELGATLKDKIGKSDTLRINLFSNTLLSASDSIFSKAMESYGAASADPGALMENITFFLPHNYKPDDTWKVKSKTNGMDSETEYILKSVESKIATVHFKTKVNGSGEIDVQGMPVAVNTKGTVEGNFTTNIETSNILRKTMQSDLSSTMEMMGQTMEMSAKGETTVTNTIK